MDRSLIELLANNKVELVSPQTTYISEEVAPSRIRGATIYPCCRISGKETLIMEGTELGKEAPVTLEDCQLGPSVKFKGGYARQSTFLKGVEIGSGAQIREGCLLEEFSKVAHTVGLKQTILFPYVTLGSLINFCDCLMAGGTDGKNHSEVGSSYIHFNFTPNQDKATPSLIGDVPRGVLIAEPPIFLGGQGGMVGPLRVEYGVVVAAGVILRKDALKRGSVVLGEKTIDKTVPFHKGYYPNFRRILELNILYIANLVALRSWYLDVRAYFFKDIHDQMLLKAAVNKIELGIEERIKRLEEVILRLPESMRLEEHLKEQADPLKKSVFEKWPLIKTELQDYSQIKGDLYLLEAIERLVQRDNEKEYLKFVKNLSDPNKTLCRSYLMSIVNEMHDRIFKAHLSMEARNWIQSTLGQTA